MGWRVSVLPPYGRQDKPKTTVLLKFSTRYLTTLHFPTETPPTNTRVRPEPRMEEVQEEENFGV
jgi:hypothetical protein